MIHIRGSVWLFACLAVVGCCESLFTYVKVSGDYRPEYSADIEALAAEAESASATAERTKEDGD